MFGEAYNFNQCLSLWAGKARSDVNLDSMFSSSGCTDKNPVVNVAPWCQTAEQCSTQSASVAPSVATSDFPSFLPTDLPSNAPTVVIPTTSPTTNPSTNPTTSPTKQT